MAYRDAGIVPGCASRILNLVCSIRMLNPRPRAYVRGVVGEALLRDSTMGRSASVHSFYQVDVPVNGAVPPEDALATCARSAAEPP
jgi:hypothetical protein